jgi:hypothetical protein
MTKRLPLLAAILLLGCASSPAPSNADFLARCWGAVPRGAGEYELAFEAISFVGLTEGGVFARSTRCPDARLGFYSMPPEIDERFRQEEVRVATRRLLGVGLRGRARIVPLERVNDFFLEVNVTQLLSLERMSDDETEAFIRQHHIG